MSITQFDLDTPFPDIFPPSWAKLMPECDFMMFRNLDHFKSVVTNITQVEAEKCDMSYEKALNNLVKGVSDFPEEEQATLRNLVRSNLHKRGLITEEVYENFRYTSDGTNVDVDVGKYVSGEAECVISPTHQYIDFFYELYISISYPYQISNSDIRTNIAKLLATIEELERQHVFIKITLILPINNVTNDYNHYFSAIPLFSHKEPKSVSSMSAVVNDRLLRKFYFAILENTYKEKLSSCYGQAKDLEGCMNVGDEFNEIEFFEQIQKDVGMI